MVEETLSLLRIISPPPSAQNCNHLTQWWLMTTRMACVPAAGPALLWVHVRLGCALVTKEPEQWRGWLTRPSQQVHGRRCAQCKLHLQITMRLVWVLWKICCQPSLDPTWWRHALIRKSKYGIILILGIFTINVITYKPTLIIREPNMKKVSFEWNNQSNDLIYFVDKCKLFVNTNVIRWMFVCSVLKTYYRARAMITRPVQCLK